MELVAEGVPHGYGLHFRKSPLTAPWEPLYSKTVDGVVTIGVRIQPAHCNGRGFAHGGFVSALADNAMGLSVIATASRQGARRLRGGTTVNLAVDFLAAIEIGQWVEFAPRVLKIGGSLGFADCVVLADGEPVARASATFRLYLASDDAGAEARGE